MITMENRICVVTGATAGIGLAVARGLAARGATLALIARGPAEVTSCVNTIQRESGNSAIRGFTADLSLIREVRRVAEELAATYPSLHVLVNNAGALFPQRTLTTEGLESNQALNHLAHFALTNGVLHLLKASAPARVVNVVSVMHFFGTRECVHVDKPHKYNRWRAYAQAKLASTLFTYELARHLEGSGVTANAVHPGFVGTDFAANSDRWLDRFLRWSMPVAAIRPERAADAILHLAISPELQGTSGKYFAGKRITRSSRLSYDPQLASELWRFSEQLCHERAPAGDP